MRAFATPFLIFLIKIVVGIFWECSGLSSLLDLKSYGQVLTEMGKLISSNHAIDTAYALAGNLSSIEQQILNDSGFNVSLISWLGPYS
jgi:hypothetical protein